MSKLSRKEFKDLLLEWNKNFINEFRDTRRYERPERPDESPFQACYKFRLWLINKLNKLKEEKIIGFENFKNKLSEELINLSRNASNDESDEALVFNTFIEYKNDYSDLYENVGKQFLEHVEFCEKENCKEDDFFYVIVGPMPDHGFLLSSLYSYSHEDDLDDIQERKKFFIGENFPFFEFEIAYKSTHSDIEQDIENNYFKLHKAECFKFKAK